MIPGINIDEYVGEIMALYREQEMVPTKNDVAMSIADILCAQGIIGTDDAELDLAVKQIEDGLDYYLSPRELATMAEVQASQDETLNGLGDIDGGGV